MIKFLIDTQLPPLLARYLRNKNHDAKHSTYFLNGHLFQDAELIKKALEHDLIIVTKDIDFLDHYVLNGSPPRVLLLQFGNVSNSELYSLFDIYLNQIVEEFNSGAQIVLFDKSKIVTY